MTAAGPTRQERRKAATRAKLVAAARTLFAAKGIDATRINEITDEGDVGFGSFYSHFESKEAIVAAVIEEEAEAIGQAIDAVTADVEDPAEVVSIAHRTLVELAREDPQWGWLAVRLEISHDLVFGALGPYAVQDLDRGVRAGRFTVDDKATALIATGGALLGVVRAVLSDRAPKAVARHHAAGVLRLYGLSPEDAAEVARRPLPRIDRGG